MADKDFEEKYYEFKNDIAEDYLSSEFESHWGDYSLYVWYEYHDPTVVVELVDVNEFGQYGTVADILPVKDFLNMDIKEFESFIGQLAYYGTFEYDERGVSDDYDFE